MTQFKATIHHQGQTYIINVPPDQTILDAANDQGLNLPCSCYTGVCTTCAAQLLAGEVDQSQGIGMGDDAKDYVLLCVSYAKSDVEILTEKEEEVYALRFGRIE